MGTAASEDNGENEDNEDNADSDMAAPPDSDWYVNVPRAAAKPYSEYVFVVQGCGGYVAGVQTTLRATGPLPADEAWERYADLDRWRHWAPQISGVSVGGPAAPAPTRRLHPGLRGTVRVAGLVHLPFEVLTVDEAARTWSWRVALGPVRLHLDHGVEDQPDGAPRERTRTWLRTTGPAPVVLAYAPLALLALHALLLER